MATGWRLLGEDGLLVQALAPKSRRLLLVVIQVERERAGLGRVTGEKAHTRLSR